MTGSIVIGAVGLALVLLSLVLGDIFDGIFDAFDLDVGGGILSAPVLGSFLASFGFGAALIMFSTGTGAIGGALGGLGAGAVVGGLALLMMRNLMHMPTDDSMDSADLVWVTGNVVTPIPEGGFGEVIVRHLGQLQKLISTDGASDLARDVASNVEQGLQIGSDLTGLDLRELLAGLAQRRDGKPAAVGADSGADDE